MYKLSQIDDEWLRIFTAIVNDCSHCIKCSNVNKKRREMALPLRQERKRRKLQKLSVYDHLILPPGHLSINFKSIPKVLPIGFDLKLMDNDEIKIWNSMASEIMDFSCLGRGIRAYIEALMNESFQELETRNLESQFLCELTL